MDAFTQGLMRQNTFAKLSSSDLESMGKRASAMYLCGKCSLNDAIVKMAQEHPSISPHQVRRVVEFANQETFARLFDDGEKYAQDKNIDFDLADPGDILHQLDSGAQPSMVMTGDDDYSMSPVKTASVSVEQDLELIKMFGLDMATPGSEKTAAAMVSIKDDDSLQIDRILSVKEASGPMSFEDWAGPAHTDEAGKKWYGKGIVRSEEDARNAYEKHIPPQLRSGGAGEKTAADRIMQAGEDGTTEDPAAALSNEQKSTDAGPELDAREAGIKEAGFLTHNLRTINLPRSKSKKKHENTGSKDEIKDAREAGLKEAVALTKQAMAYVKQARPESQRVLEDLRSGVSLDRIKVALAQREQNYPDANPFGDLIRTKQKLAKVLDDAVYARDRNHQLQKAASDEFSHHVAQYMLNGGNFGEVAHMLGSVTSDADTVKEAMTAAAGELGRLGFDLAKVQGQVLHYQMTKSASVRVVDTNHPIVASFMGLAKLADAQSMLEKASDHIQGMFHEVDTVLSQAMVQNAAS